MTVPEPADSCELTVSVKALCDFAAREGDLDLRFSPTPSAQEGIEGHRQVVLRRPAHFRREVSLSGVCDGLTVRGRADGWDERLGRIEEIKTYRGEVERIKGNQRALHWAQVKIYGALFCRTEARPSIRLALVYFNLDSESETLIEEEHTAPALWVFLQTLIERYRVWGMAEARHRVERDQRCRELAFPHPSFRSGQREVAEAVYRAASQERDVLINAPTGIGKSIASIFPMLKALPEKRLDKVFFLTAKGSGKASAHDAIGDLGARRGSSAVRVLELTARDKTCVYPDLACHGESCPLARGFYDRLPAARAEAQNETTWSPQRMRQLAEEHSVCPYFLAQEMSRWADLIVADYNYYFDQNAILYALMLQNQWRVGVLVDEAHNLVERGRDMYSAQLDATDLLAVEKDAGVVLKRLSKRVRSAWRAAAAANDAKLLLALPEILARALDALVRQIAEEMAERAAELVAGVLDHYFHILHFARLLESFGDHSALYFAANGQPLPSLVLQNCVPARFLAERARAAHAVIYFSATLTPFPYYRNLLGSPDDAVEVDIASPFSAEQLSVRIAPHVSTRHATRDQSSVPIAAIMREQYRARPGNYLAFFSSYVYLNQVRDTLVAMDPDLPVWTQERAMDDQARRQFLERMTATSRGISFAVLGGSFSEAVDLPGERLIGAFVVTLGLPQVNASNDILRERLHAHFGSGFEYAYLYPGLRKVVQAAGRVIRTPSDRGVIHLIDERFSERRVQDLLPAWWPTPVASAIIGRPAGTVG